MDTLQMIAILVVVILILMFVYYFFNKQKALTTGIRDAQKYYYVDSASLNLNESESTPEMGVSIWVYVSDWVQADGRDRIILYMGPDTAMNTAGSVVYGLKSNAKLSKSDTSYQDSSPLTRS